MKAHFTALASALALLSLAGCDLVKDAGAQVAKAFPVNAQTTLVIHPGYKMIVDGREAPVFGKDECPPANTAVMISIFGADPENGKRSCIVIAPDTKKVFVTVGLPDGATDEIWSVERSGDRTMLRRENGSYLSAAK